MTGREPALSRPADADAPSGLEPSLPASQLYRVGDVFEGMRKPGWWEPTFSSLDKTEPQPIRAVIRRTQSVIRETGGAKNRRRTVRMKLFLRFWWVGTDPEKCYWREVWWAEDLAGWQRVSVREGELPL